MTAKKYIILSGADIYDYDLLRSKIAQEDFVICADSGIRHASKLGITADIWIGDFDSAGDSEYYYKEKITLPCKKDDTDTMSAARIAVKNKAEEVLIFGGIGSRLDHTLGNIMVLDFLCGYNIKASLINEKNEITLISNQTIRVERKKDTFLSLIPYGSSARGVNVSGVEYPLANAELKTDFPIGVSNRITSEFAEIGLSDGKLLVMVCRD